MPENDGISKALSEIEQSMTGGGSVEQNVASLIAELLKWKEIKKTTEDVVKDANKKIDAVTEQIKSIMEHAGFTSVGTALGVVRLVPKSYFSIDGSKKEEAYEWLRANIGEDIFGVNQRTLNAVISEYVESHQEDTSLPPAFKVFEKMSVSIRKS